MRNITLLLSLLASGYLSAEPTVRYDISFPNATHHEAEIRATFSGVDLSKPLKVVMSRSSPGRYALHEFAKNVSRFRATDAQSNALRVEHKDPYSWDVTPQSETIICYYTLYGDLVDGTYAAIDQTHAHLNLPATLIWAEGMAGVPATLAFHVPEGSGWKAATQLIPNPDGTFSAPAIAGSALEWMMDSPVELSASPIREWTYAGQTFRLALHHQGSDADAEQFEDLCKRVVAEERGVFGELPHYDHGTYTFLVDFLPWAHADGMEHRDSTVITGDLELKNSMQRAIGIVSHEFFHSWNVKRIRPKSLEPFAFERADMSGELWFAEGFTNYYGDLVLKRAGLDTLDDFAQNMSGALNAVLNDPGHNVASAVEMSQDAPFVDAAKSVDPTNWGNNFISYYIYGQALAFGIDLAIRERFPGKSLDDWMRTIWREHPDIEKPYTIADLENTLAKTTGDPAFAHQIFTDNITGLKPLDYATLSDHAGFALILAHPGKPWLGGPDLQESENGLRVADPTLRGSPVYAVGIDTGDAIYSCGQDEVKTISNLSACLALHKPGDAVVLGVRGRGGDRTVTVQLGQDPTLELKAYEQLGRSVPSDIERFRKEWLGSRSAN